MTATVQLRDLEWTDLEVVSEIERALFPDDCWSIGTWWSELAGRPRRDYVVAVDGGIPDAGPARLRRARPRRGHRRRHDDRDRPGAQRRGVGRLLLDELVAAAAARGAAALLLEVRADNAAARALYDRNDFDVIATRRRYYQPGDVDALVMRRHLRPDDPTGETR